MKWGKFFWTGIFERGGNYFREKNLEGGDTILLGGAFSRGSMILGGTCSKGGSYLFAETGLPLRGMRLVSLMP